jgi:DNA-binding transcriptional ArsR family regulator
MPAQSAFAAAPFVLPEQPAEPDLVAKYFRGLGDVTRVRLLALLEERGEMSVSELVAAVDQAQSNVSNHLACLRWCGFVDARRDGRTVRYRLADHRVVQLLGLGRSLLADNAEHVAALWPDQRGLLMRTHETLASSGRKRSPTGGARVKIEILYFDGCPGHEPLLPSLRELAAGHGAELEHRHIQTLEEAEQARFLGSPSVRVNGVDVEPGAAERADFGLKCRLYRSPDGQSGLPPRDWIERALRDAAA